MSTQFKKYINFINEAGYLGSGGSFAGAGTFRGGPFGYGGALQLAGGLSAPVKKLKKQRDKEAAFDIEKQMGINRGYPAPQSITGYPGGESRSGISSGVRIPNSINLIAMPIDMIEDLYPEDYKDDYWGFNKKIDDDNFSDENVVQDIDFNLELDEQRSVSDQNYRHLPGFPRHNSIEKHVRHVPTDKNDINNDGEADEYLSDKEYVSDILKKHGIKNTDISEQKYTFLERTLYHGTVNDHLKNIKDHGLSSDLGDFVKNSYGIEFDEEEIEEKLGGIIFAAEKEEIDKAVGAMRYHIGQKLNKYLTDVDEHDLLKHGMLVIIRNVESSQNTYDFEKEEWYQKPKNNDDDKGYNYPVSVEPGDWFYKSDRGVVIDDILTGKKMLQFLRRLDGLKHVESDMRRKLFKLIQKTNNKNSKEEIIKKIKSIPKHDLPQHIKFYQDKLSNKKEISEQYNNMTHNTEPSKGIERYKQGRAIVGQQRDLDKVIIKRVDYSKGHRNIPAAETSPGNQAYGNVGFPKKFVPDDWEQRHWKTKSIKNYKHLNADIQNLIDEYTNEAFEEAYTGIDGDEFDKPKGGSAAFEKNRKKVIADLKKEK